MHFSPDPFHTSILIGKLSTPTTLPLVILFKVEKSFLKVDILPQKNINYNTSKTSVILVAGIQQMMVIIFQIQRPAK